MKLFWSGTDSLMLLDVSRRCFKKKIYWKVFRVLIRLIDRFIECHYCDSENIAENVRMFGTKKEIKVFKDRIAHTEKYEKIEHNGFNVIYYVPDSVMERNFVDWLYGADVIDRVKYHFYQSDINFIKLDGSMSMKSVYPISDFYLRPNRHDGSSRMVQECEIQEIPYYHSVTNPEFEIIIKKIYAEYKKKP